MIYHIFANRSNIGDWLSAKGIQKLLQTEAITECLCDEPFVDETMNILSNATKDDLIIIGGGGLLMDYFIPFWEAFKPFADHIPFIIWGIGYCDIKHEPSLPPNVLIEEIVNKSKLCIVRDELSQSHLPHCYLPAPIPCPSINVIEPVLEMGNDLLHVVNYTTATPEVYEVMRREAKKFAVKTNCIYRETNNLISKGSVNELENVLALYKRSGIILSSALHGCIIGVSMGLKVLAVSGDRKIEGFMKSVGLIDWVLDLSEVDLVQEKLQKVHLQPDSRSKLKYYCKENQKIALQIRQMTSGI